jgi:uncharacterized membrane protein YbhN (UPF0104 family)
MPFWLVRINMEIDFITHCHVVIYQVNIIIIIIIIPYIRICLLIDIFIYICIYIYISFIPYKAFDNAWTLRTSLLNLTLCSSVESIARTYHSSVRVRVRGRVRGRVRVRVNAWTLRSSLLHRTLCNSVESIAHTYHLSVIYFLTTIILCMIK